MSVDDILGKKGLAGYLVWGMIWGGGVDLHGGMDRGMGMGGCWNKARDRR